MASDIMLSPPFVRKQFCEPRQVVSLDELLPMSRVFAISYAAADSKVLFHVLRVQNSRCTCISAGSPLSEFTVTCRFASFPQVEHYLVIEPAMDVSIDPANE